MRTYVIRRLLLFIPTLLLVTIIVFIAMRLIPGNIVDQMASESEWLSDVTREKIEHALGLDVPYPFLVLNKVLTSRYDPGQISQQVEETYGVPVAGVLPLAEALIDLGSTDIFSLVEPEHAWSKELAKITQAVLAAE